MLARVKLSDGARISLRLGATTAESVAYRAVVTLTEGEWGGDANVALADGAVSLANWSPADPPDWVARLMTALLRAEWRARKDGPGAPWPRRLTRWRASRDGA